MSQKSRKTIVRLWDRDWSLETATLMRDYQKYDILENELLHNNFILPECSRYLWWNYIQNIQSHISVKSRYRRLLECLGSIPCLGSTFCVGPIKLELLNGKNLKFAKDQSSGSNFWKGSKLKLDFQALARLRLVCLGLEHFRTLSKQAAARCNE